MKTLIFPALAALAMTAMPAAAQSTGDWSGAYVGVFGGVAGANDAKNERLVFDRDFDGDFDDTVVTAVGGSTDAFAPGSCAGTPYLNSAASGCVQDRVGYDAGIRGGYDLQSGSWVYGIVGDVGTSDAEDSVTSFSSTPAAYTFNRRVDLLVGLRGRIGYLFGPNLVYATGGVAFAKVDNTFFTTNTANTFTLRNDEDSADGFQAGFGIEAPLSPKVRFVAEYLYTGLDADNSTIRIGQGTALATNPFILAPNTAGTDTQRSASDFDIHGFRVGLNYSF